MFTSIKITFIIFFFKICTSDKGEYIGCYDKEFEQRWERFNGTVDSCLDKCEEIFYRYSVLNQDRCRCSNSINAELNQTDCNTYCKLDPDKFCGGIDAESYYATDLKVPSPPRNLRSVTANRTDTSLVLQWDPPEVQNTLTQYLIESEIIKTYNYDPLFKPTWTFDSVTKQAQLVNLHPGSTYRFILKTLSNNGEGGNATIVEHTVIGVPHPMPESPTILSKTDTTVKIQIKQAENINGPVSWYEIVVNYVDDELTENFNSSLLQNYNEAQNYGLPYYITAKLNYENRSKEFTVGDGQMYQGYLNAPLDPERHAHITIGVVSRFEDIEKRRYSVHTHDDDEIIQIFNQAVHPHENSAGVENQDSDTLVTILTVAVVLFSLILVGTIAAFFYIRHKIGNAQGLHRLSDVHEMALQGPIVEMVNNGFMHEPEEQGNFQQKLNAVYDKLNYEQKLSRNLLTLDIDHIIGTGNYGDVIKGNINQGSVSYACQVHLVSDDMDKENETTFFRSCNNLLKALPHKNLLSFYGICKTNDWVYVVLEDVSYTLKKHLLLLRERSIWNSSYRSLEENVLSILIELLEAMEYLTSKNILHKQLCAHNIKVTGDYGLKLSIFGPPLYDDQGKSIDLSRWYAPEVLKYRNHTIKSDIWSFGCLIWETCCLGGTLYSNLNSSDLLSRIKNGARPEQPNFMSDDLYQMLLNCWELDQNERPQYKDIQILLQQFLTMPGHALTYELDVNGGVTTILPYYLPLLEIVN